MCSRMSKLLQTKGGTFFETQCIYIFGVLPRRNFATYKIHLHPSLVFSYICSVTARHSSTLRRGTRNGIMELLQRAPPIFGWAAIMLGIGPHSSFHRHNYHPKSHAIHQLYASGKRLYLCICLWKVFNIKLIHEVINLHIYNGSLNFLMASVFKHISN